MSLFGGLFVGLQKKKKNTGEMSLLFLYNGVMKATGPTTYSAIFGDWVPRS